MERFTELKKTEFEPVLEAEKTAIKQAHKAWEKYASARRRIFKDLWYKCVNHLPDGMTIAELLVSTIPLISVFYSIADRNTGRAWL